jgi:NAD(P)-dependent dehydrogenase (short-subunit alcohol dehydrogenase family)
MTATTPPAGLVTGASRGIGRAVAQSLLEEGWQVFLCSRSPESLEATLEELRQSHGDRARGRVVDVRSESEVDGLVDWVVALAGRLDCLVNNAGLGAFGSVEGISGEDWRRVIDTNLSGAFYALRAAARPMKEQGDGWIFNIASIAATHAFAGGAAYNASKFGLLGLSEAAMLDLRQHGVRVTTILPGTVDTEFGGPATGAPTQSSSDWKLQPEDVARAVIDLLRYPRRALPSRLELRPSRPPAG